MDAEGRVRQWAQAPFEQRVKVVCGDCNNGWMSALEWQAKPFLTSMMLGRRQELRPRIQKLLAFWAVKTALVIDHLQPKSRVVPDAEYPKVYRIRSPLRSHLVWLGYRTVPHENPGELLVVARTQPVAQLDTQPEMKEKFLQWAAEGRKMYRVTFAVGNLAVQVFGHDFPWMLNVAVPPQGYVERVWPMTGRFTWPPRRSLDEIGGLDGMHRAFDQSPTDPAEVQG
jgi:hypothetical protein